MTSNSLGVNAVQSVINDFQLCTAKCMTAGGTKGGPGWRWANGAMGYSMFNTVAPPNYNLGAVVGWTAASRRSMITTSKP